VQVNGLLFVFNIADLAMLTGVSVVFASVIVRRVKRISLERA
jgi:lipoprotein signal peptidase